MVVQCVNGLRFRYTSRPLICTTRSHQRSLLDFRVSHTPGKSWARSTCFLLLSLSRHFVFCYSDADWSYADNLIHSSHLFVLVWNSWSLQLKWPVRMQYFAFVWYLELWVACRRRG
ncbi:hypothetical protein BDV93DRAFT_23972 [Ceratobasidium sp. AG-I]|nr:hypothetical protein BDV93DRAFT_23972 [Ceratobasidium sp. AG-I]